MLSEALSSFEGYSNEQKCQSPDDSRGPRCPYQMMLPSHSRRHSARKPLSRREYFALMTAAVAGAALPSRASEGAPSQVTDAEIAATHNALFDLWFPLAALNLRPSVRGDIAAIAAQVNAGMLQAFRQSSLLNVLTAMTVPQALPFYPCLAASPNPAVDAFIKTPGGFGSMPVHHRSPLFSFFFDGYCGALSTQTAQILREAYLSGIWDLPLAEPLADFIAPPVFVNRPDIYAKRHAPVLPPSPLIYDSVRREIRHREGLIEYLVIGSGPAGATVAHQLRESGKRVVLIEKGPFVVWGSMNTRSYGRLMYAGDRAATTDNGVIIRSGETVGGGSAVNIDLAFSPLEATIQARINDWIEDGRIDGRYYSTSRLATAYEWVRRKIRTRTLDESELNRDNRALWDGADAYGVNPSLYHLNRFAVGASPSPVDDKRDAGRQLLREAMENTANPLSVIPDATVDEVLFTADAAGELRATGVRLRMTAPWTEYGNTIVDPAQLRIEPGVPVTIQAENVVLSAGTIGTTRILLNSARSTPLLDNPQIGRGLILHPSFPILGLFDETINLLQGLDSATYVDSFGVTPGFIFETMAGLPAYGALLVPGSGKQVYEEMSRFNDYVGFGCMLVDTPSNGNRIALDSAGNTIAEYALSGPDKARFRVGVAVGIRMMFLAGAKKVIIPTNENVLGLNAFDPMVGAYLTNIAQADFVERNLQFIPNRTVLTSAHLQATNKIGRADQGAVVSLNQRVYTRAGREIANLYAMDSSIFPTSVGANPMQSLYTFAKIFADRLIQGIR
jgi:hypothetical protein